MTGRLIYVRFCPCRAIRPAYEGIETRTLFIERLSSHTAVARSAPPMRGLKPQKPIDTLNALLGRAIRPAYEGIETHSDPH